MPCTTSSSARFDPAVDSAKSRSSRSDSSASTGLERRLAVVLVALEGRRGGRVDVGERRSPCRPAGRRRSRRGGAPSSLTSSRASETLAALAAPPSPGLLPDELLVFFLLAFLPLPMGVILPDRPTPRRGCATPDPVAGTRILARCACSSPGPPPSPPPPTSTRSATRRCMPPTPHRGSPGSARNMVTTLDGSATGADGRSGGDQHRGRPRRLRGAARPEPRGRRRARAPFATKGIRPCRSTSAGAACARATGSRRPCRSSP